MSDSTSNEPVCQEKLREEEDVGTRSSHAANVRSAFYQDTSLCLAFVSRDVPSPLYGLPEKALLVDARYLMAPLVRKLQAASHLQIEKARLLTQHRAGRH